MDEKKAKSLVAFAEMLARCPCCEEVSKCLDGCTIEEDSRRTGASALTAYELMVDARAALRGEFGE